jgi:glutathionyl-hydroquinone reductase
LTASGTFRRQPSKFLGPVEPAAGRYHLYVSLACPWSQRAVIVRALKGLQDAVGISYIDPYRDDRGWHFSGGEVVDDLGKFEYLSEAYYATDPDYDGRISVPVLWDKEEGRIACNESSELVRIWGSGEWDEFASEPDLDLYPAELRSEIDSWNDRIYDDFNNAVYQAGFARSQSAYEAAYRKIFTLLPSLEEHLASSRYLAGDRITEADWRLFVTLVRFDSVYYVHFKCNGARIVDFPNLWDYTRELYQWPGIAETVAMDQIKVHYYTTHDSVNPNRLIPAGPENLDFTAPHGRG